MRLALLTVCLLTVAAPTVRAFPTATKIKQAFTAIDTTRNNAISAAEWDAASFALFRAADKNNNNFIDGSELQGSTLAQDTFLRADTDRDGRLSVGEFMELRRTIFRVADIDRNDSLSLLEFELMILLEQVGWTDRNNNGRIELSELADSLRKAFEQLDTNQDGLLTTEEASFLQPEFFKMFDTDQNGKLSSAEFVAGYRNALLSL